MGHDNALDVVMGMNVADELNQLREMVYQPDGNDLEALKGELEPLAKQLKQLKLKKDEAESFVSGINKEIMAVETRIREIWGPLVHSDKADLAVGDMKLTIEKSLNVSQDDKLSAIEWLNTNGFSDVLKLDIHTQTLYSLAREKFKEEGVEIPGLKYSTFQKIKIK